MKKYVILFLLLKASVSFASNVVAFDIRPETIIFNEVSYHLEDGQSPRLIEQTIIGRFYQGNNPVLVAREAGSNVHLTPYSVLSEMLAHVESKKYDILPQLYSAATREQVAQRLNDPEIGPQIVEWLNSLKTLEVLGVWLESPNLLIAYVQVNELEDGVRPYVFEFNDGWYLRAGHFDSEFSNQLDAFYSKHSNDDMEIISPPSLEEMSSLVNDAELVKFASDIGLSIL